MNRSVFLIHIWEEQKVLDYYSIQHNVKKYYWLD